MDYQKLKEQWLLEKIAEFQGWDFSRLDGRWAHDELPWDYAEIVCSYLSPEHRLLDMGTGGGEFLLTLQHPYPLTSVTEAYPPNAELCFEKLAPLGIQVKQVLDDGQLPFENDTFDIIINRHEYFDMREVRRVLKPNGIFITQQVGGENSFDLSAALIPGVMSQFPEHTLKNNVELIASQAFEILMQAEDFPVTRFFDVGAIVYFAKAAVWDFPGFSVEGCFSQLCNLQEQLEETGLIENREHRFIIVSQKIHFLTGTL